MIFVEPESARRTRLHYAASPPALPVLEIVRGPHAHLADRHRVVISGRVQPLGSGFWCDPILEAVAERDGDPIRISSLVSVVVKVGNFSRRPEREHKKLELFREIGRLIRSGQLRRVRRNFVILGGRDALPPAPRALSPAHRDEPLPLPQL